MLKKTKVFLTVLGLAMMLSTPVFADSSFDLSAQGYAYFTDSYDQQSGLEPVDYGYIHEDGGKKFGYADKDGNIKIPIHNNWDNASQFNNGMAVVYDESIQTCLAIDTSGNTVFKFQPNTYYSGSYSLANSWNDIEFLNNDPNSMFCVYETGFGDSVAPPNNPSITFYDRKGNYKTVSLSNYGDISKFNNGVATLSKLTSSEDTSSGDFDTAEYSYTPVATINTKGEILPIANPIKVSSSERLSGNNRYETAVAISQKGWNQSDNVILTSGEDYPDALVGTSFAYLKNAPILITPSDKLDSEVSAEIARLQAKNVYILGSDTTISQNVDNELKEKYNVVRIGGTGLYDTAVNVGNEIRKTKQFDTVVIAPEGDYPDALAIAPFSAMNTMPILFSEKDSLRPDTMTAIQEWGIKNIIIVGGPGVISPAIDRQLIMQDINITYLAGQDRYDTALEIIKHFEPSQGYKSIAVASGESYPDALTGAGLAAKYNIPLVLVGKDSVKTDISDYINNHTISNAYIFGGTGAVSDEVISK